MVGYEMLAQSQRDLTAEQVIDTKFTHRTVTVRCKIKWHNITKHLTVLLPDVFRLLIYAAIFVHNIHCPAISNSMLC